MNRTPPSGAQTRDIVVIGASAGGVEALRRLLADLPGDLPASVSIVLHVGAASVLASVLGRVARLPVVEGKSGTPIERGVVYVAVPGAHMLLHDGHILCRRGPRENLARPAVDPLFRSAACSFGARVIGVVLSGNLNDGTAGLRAIKRCGGLAVAQDPSEAAVPSMPESAVQHVDIDHCAPMAKMAGLLTRLCTEAAGKTPEIPNDIKLEAAISAMEVGNMKIDDRLGDMSPFTCPECQGSLWEIADGDILRYRCHVGHAFTADSMLAAQEDEIEATLWKLMRAHQQRAELARRLAAQAGPGDSDTVTARMREQAREHEESAELMRALLERRGSILA